MLGTETLYTAGQTRALDQGDGLATPFFNSLYSTVISHAFATGLFRLAIPVLPHTLGKGDRNASPQG